MAPDGLTDGHDGMAMTLVEMGTSLGAATGYVYSATMTSAFGWGVAYLAIGVAGTLAFVAPLALFDGPHPYTPPRALGESAARRARKTAEADGFLAKLLGFTPALGEVLCAAPRAKTGASADVRVESAANAWAFGSGATDDGASAGTKLLNTGGNAGGGASDGAARGAGASESVPASFAAQLGAMFTSPALVLLYVGLACSSGGMQGLQVFFPTIGIDVGLWPSELVAAASFGGSIVLGALMGGPMQGVLASWMRCARAAPDFIRDSMAIPWPSSGPMGAVLSAPSP